MQSLQGARRRSPGKVGVDRFGLVDLSLIVAVAAFALSAVSLTWQALRVWWDRPVVLTRASLHGRSWDLGYGGTQFGWECELRITNVGERAVTVVDAGYWFGPGTHFEDVERPFDGKAFPVRIEPHDQVRLTGSLNEGTAWDARHAPQGDEGVGELPVRPFVELVQRPLRWKLNRTAGVVRLYAENDHVPNPHHGL